jgi:hypothetical protein
MHAVNADYKIGWDDTSTFEHRQYPCLHSDISRADWSTLAFIEGIQHEPLKDIVKDLAFDKAVINLAMPSSIQFPHTHGDSTVITYYINPEWKNEYYGETIFYDDSLLESIKVALYEPNSCVVFDGNIPHSIRPASHIAPSYRFSLSVFYRQKNFIEEAKNSS